MTIAGLVAVITSVLARARIALLVASWPATSLAGALAAGGAITSAALVALMHYEHSARTSLSAATSP